MQTETTTKKKLEREVNTCLEVRNPSLYSLNSAYASNRPVWPVGSDHHGGGAGISFGSDAKTVAYYSLPSTSMPTSRLSYQLPRS